MIEAALQKAAAEFQGQRGLQPNLGSRERPSTQKSSAWESTSTGSKFQRSG